MDVSWLITEPLYVTAIESPDDDHRVLVTDAGRRWAAMLTYTDGKILANGEFVDLGDDVPVVLGIMDYAEAENGKETYVELEDGATIPFPGEAQ